MAHMTAEIKAFLHDTSSTWSYVVADPATGSAAVIDPVRDFDGASGRSSTKSAAALVAHVREQGLSLQWILETHAHADHLSAAPYIRSELGGALAIGEGIRTVQKTFADIFHLDPRFPADGSQFDHLFANGEQFRLGDIDAEVIPVPGHTNDSVAYRIGDAVFVGDSLFMPDSGTARCDFPGGDAATLYRSIHRLYELPPETRMFVCHDYAPGGREHRCETTVAEQRASNIHVRDGVSEEEFVKLRTERDATLDMPTLLLPSVQVNIRAGAWPDPEDNGVSYLKLPVDMF
jgi:glyoxylase-like metal-dependent hydrolase (beta-lactamase superfamily II)